MDVDAGASGERALAIELTPAADKYRTADLRRAFFSRITEVVRALPGVEQAGLTDQLPGRASELILARAIRLDGQETPPGTRELALLATASPDTLPPAASTCWPAARSMKGTSPVRHRL